MKLIIGGFAQGKLEYVLETVKAAYCLIDETNFQNHEEHPAEGGAFIDSAILTADAEVVIINHLHLIIREIGQKESAKAWIHKLIDVCSVSGRGLIIISDEVGSGVIPIDADDRKFREDVGRILCDLAREAEHVERIICGLPQILK